jgi:hypothetical protein
VNFLKTNTLQMLFGIHPGKEKLVMLRPRYESNAGEGRLQNLMYVHIIHYMFCL